MVDTGCRGPGDGDVGQRFTDSLSAPDLHRLGRYGLLLHVPTFCSYFTF